MKSLPTKAIPCNADESCVSEQISHGEGEEESDIFAIREVSFQPEGEADWKETSYTLNTDSLDWVRTRAHLHRPFFCLLHQQE